MSSNVRIFDPFRHPHLDYEWNESGPMPSREQSMGPVFFPTPSYISHELAAYRKKVFDLAEQKNGDPIFNGSKEQASIVVEGLFSCATKTIRILTEFLDPSIYATYEVIVTARDFLSASDDRRLEILMEDTTAARMNPFLFMLSTFPNLRVMRVSETIRAQYASHCVIADDDSYRFRENKTKPFAIAAFGDPKGGRVLTEFFLDIWQHAEDFEATYPQWTMQ